MDISEKRYIMVPIVYLKFLWMENFENKEDIFSRMIHYGIADYANRNNKTIQEAARFLRITLGNIKAIEREYSKLFLGAKPVFFMIDINLLFEYRDEPKSFNEIQQFCFYVGTRSIMGVKEYVRTNKTLITARAFGYKSYTELKATTSKVKSHWEIESKFSKRYHVDNVLIDLRLYWNVLIYSKKGMRGIYVTIGDKTKLIDLIMYAMKAEKRKEIKNLNINTLDAERQVLQQLKKEQH